MMLHTYILGIYLRTYLPLSTLPTKISRGSSIAGAVVGGFLLSSLSIAWRAFFFHQIILVLFDIAYTIVQT